MKKNYCFEWEQRIPILKKLLIIMKLTFFLIAISAFSVLANKSYSQTVSLNMEKVTLKEVLSKIEDTSGCNFMYSEKFVDVTKTVSINVENKKIEDVLISLFAGSDIRFERKDRLIILTSEANNNTSVSQQQTTVSGKVTDTSGGGLPGVSVVVKGTTTGTITDADGVYKLSNVPSNATLLFSFVGMKSQEIAVGGKTSINITLVDETIGLEEVVAVGYGVQKKSNVTGAIASVNTDGLSNRSTPNVGQAMQGKVSGVQVLNMSGAPGSSPTFRVRGYSSNGQSNPLYIVDGLKVADIGYLDPTSIGSIEILKDAASAAIYGAEAGNGVVLITTKSGKKGTSRMFYNGQYTMQQQGHKMDMMNASQFKEYWMEAGQPASVFQNANTDWNKVLFENGMRQTQTLGFEGGNDKASFYSAITYNKDDGMVIGNNDTNERVAAQINASYQVNSWMKVGTTNSIERGKIVSVSQNNMTTSGSVIGSGFFFDPTVPVYYANDADAPAGLGLLTAEAQGYTVLRNSAGQLYGSSILLQSNLWHPFGMIENYTNETWRTNINGTIYTEFKPIKGLVYTSRLGYRFGNTFDSNYSASHYWNHNQSSLYGALDANLNHNVYLQWENFANYIFSVGKNDFTAMAGMQFTSNNNTNVGGNTARLQNDALNYRYLDFSTADATDAVRGNNINQRSISYFGRLDWNYDNRYMLQGSFRADAFDASKLSKTQRWGYFPSVSGGWTVSNENFMKNLGFNALSSLKFRGSWGINGNVNVLNNYPYSSSLVLGGNSGYYSFSSPLVSGAAPSNQLPNADLTWEKSNQTNFGFESRFFDSRLTLNVDYFRKITEGLLVSNSPAPVISGTSTVARNTGKILNSGFEFELGWKGEIGDFKYSINGNLATLHNEVLDSPYGNGRFSGGGGFLTDATYFEKGYPIWYIRTYVIDHIDEANGQPVYKTAQQLGTDDGRAPQGSGIPDFTYGITLNAEYKNFDLTVFGTGQEGSKLFFAVVRPDFPYANFPEFVYTDRWTPTHTNATRPSASVYRADSWSYAASDNWVFDNSFFKIKQIQLGYTLPKSLTSHLKISSLRVYTSLEDFFVFTKYPGIDPESMGGTQNGQTITIPGGPTLSLGGGMSVDRIQYPAMKQVVFGLNLSF